MSNAPQTIEAARSRLNNLQGFLEQDPDNLNLLADVIDQALAVGEVELAGTAVQRALELQPDSAPFLLRQSSVAIADRNFDEALNLASRLIDQGVLESAVRFNQAFALSSLGRFAEARDVLEGLYAEAGNNSQRMVVVLLIRACHYLGDLERAIEVALSYLQQQPDDTQVAGMLSLLYFDSEDLAHASEWAQRSLADNSPGNVDALLAAGGVALAQEDADAARDFMHRVVQLQPGSGRAWTNLGLADLLVGDLASAREKLVQAVKYMPEHLGTWVTLGWVQLLLGEVDSAEQTFRSALAIDDTFSEIHGGLAAVAANRGDWQKADEAAKIARRLDPESMSTVYPQLLRLYKEGKGREAQDLIENALKRGNAPGGGNLLDMLGRMKKKTDR